MTPRERLREALEAMHVRVDGDHVGYDDKRDELAKALRAALELLDEPVADGERWPHGDRGETDNMRPVLYWLDDGKFARAMLVGPNRLVVDLTTGDGPSVVGKQGWFEPGYVAAYGGMVPEHTMEGTEPGQWSYGVAKLPQFCPPVADGAALLRTDGAALLRELRDDPRRVLIHETEIVATKEELSTLREQKDAAYRERDQLVCALSKVFPSFLARDPVAPHLAAELLRQCGESDAEWDAEWRWIVFVELPTGQTSWHIRDSERAWFDHLPVRDPTLEERLNALEDGHTTAEKYRRLAALSRAPAPQPAGAEAWREAVQHALDLLTETVGGHVRGSVGFPISDPNARAYSDRICEVLGVLRAARAKEQR